MAKSNRFAHISKVPLLGLLLSLFACDLPKNDFEVHIINHSKDTVYVNNTYECASCMMMQSIRQYQSHYTSCFTMVAPNDSIISYTKSGHEYQGIYSLVKDSLDEYVRKGYTYNVDDKKWANIYIIENIKPDEKKCTFIIK